MGEGLEFTFWSLAIVGTVVFVFKLIMLFVGLDGDSDLDFDLEDGGDSTGAFNLLSLQSVACLAMGTGWMGLVALLNLGFGSLHSWSLGLAFGFVLVVASAKLMQLAMSLESSGTLNLQRAVGQNGTVYLRIPEDGVGQVQVIVQGRLVTTDARSSGPSIATGTKIRVEGIDGSTAGSTLIVAPV